MSDPVTVTSGDYTVTSSSETAEQLTSNLSEGEPDLSKAASDLGKEGGKAAAAKRAEQAKEAKAEPEPETEVDEAAEAKRKLDEELATTAPDQKKRLASDRVEEATRAAAAAKKQLAAERAEWMRERSELAQLRAERQAAQRPTEQPAQRPQAPQAPQKPKVEDFESYEDFVGALARHSADEQFAKRQREAHVYAQADSYVRSLDSAVTKFNERISEMTKSEPDFMERVSPEIAGLTPSFVLAPGQRMGPQNVIADELLGSEKAPALMLHFTEHPDEFQRIAALQTPQAILREMAKLEARLEVATLGTSTPKLQVVSKAKPPVRPVAGSPHTADAVPDDSASFDEHLRYYNAKDQRRR